MVQRCFFMQAAQPGATLNEQALAQEGSVSGLKRSVLAFKAIVHTELTFLSEADLRPNSV